MFLAKLRVSISSTAQGVTLTRDGGGGCCLCPFLLIIACKHGNPRLSIRQLDDEEFEFSPSDKLPAAGKLSLFFATAELPTDE